MSAIPVASGWNKSGVSYAIELDEQNVLGPARPYKLNCGHTVPLVEQQRFNGPMPILRVTLKRRTADGGIESVAWIGLN